MEASETTEAQQEQQDRPYYCPGCGARGDYPQKCVGKAEAGHQPIEMVSTDELYDGSDPTPAPNTDDRK